MKADALRIAGGAYWVSVIDWDIGAYHGHTLKGTTYNAFLLFGKDSVALIDNAAPGTSAQMWGRIADACEKEGKETSVIDVIIQNHIETDHSGALVELNKKFPEAPIYCTEVAVKGLKKLYPSVADAPFKAVKTGETIDLGAKNVHLRSDAVTALA